MLGPSPQGETAACASAWYAWTQLAYSLSLLIGGVLFDWFSEHYHSQIVAGIPLDRFAIFFLASWLLKSLGVYWAARIRE